MSLSNLTRLEAVNRILRAAHEHPVSTLGLGGETDSLIAEQVLDEVNRRVQMHGLHCNTTETSFTPDTGNNNRVVLPINTASVRGWNEHAYRNYFFREVSGEFRLYDGDKDPATDQFDDDNVVYVQITQVLDFEDLPFPIQFWIADEAAFEYAQAVLPSNSALGLLAQRAARSRAEGRQYNMRSTPHNQFFDGRAQGPRVGRAWTPRHWPYNDLRSND